MTAGDVRTCRAKLHISQAELAQLLGVHSLTVSKWERGKLRPTAYQAALIAAFDVAVEHKPGIGPAIERSLAANGPIQTLYGVLKAAFG